MTRGFDVPEATALPEQDGATFSSLVALMRRLLDEDGCPWDREQDYKSLRRYVMEEACEVIDAIDGENPAELRDELGDLLLQVAFLGELARRDGHFGPDDVVRGICAKLVRRHPHVFGDVAVTGSAEVLRNWEAIKQTEKAGEQAERPLLGGLPRSLPALLRAQRMGEKASRVGFDWPDGEGPRRKVTEELLEVDEAIAAGDRESVEQELGDLLFAVVNLARHHRVDAELALRGASDRFADRFGHVEARVKEHHGGWPRGEQSKPAVGLPLAELDGYWEEAKRRQV